MNLSGSLVSKGLPGIHTLLPQLIVRVAGRLLVAGSEYKGRRNLVLVLAEEAGDPLLGALARLGGELQQKEAQVIAVLPPGECTAEQLAWTAGAPVLAAEAVDEDVYARFGAIDTAGKRAWAVYVTDRWGEIFAFWRACSGDARPAAEEILSWLDHINHQCEECLPSAWMLDRSSPSRE